MRIIYFGSSQFSCTILQALLKDAFDVRLVVSQPDKPKGRHLQLHPTEVSAFACAASLDLAKPESLRSDSIEALIKRVAADLLVVADYGKILPQAILRSAQKLAVAVHPSLLPLHRGPAPINWVLFNGEEETGVTIFKMDEHMDSGPIILQERTHVRAEEDAVSLHQRLAELSALALVKALKMIERDAYTLTPQDVTRVTYARKLSKKDGRISWTLSAYQIHNAIRALAGWPGSYVCYKGKMLKISSALPVELYPEASPGSIVAVTRSGIDVMTGRGVIRFLRVKPEGKPEMDAWSFVAGHRVQIGEKFE